MNTLIISGYTVEYHLENNTVASLITFIGKLQVPGVYGLSIKINDTVITDENYVIQNNDKIELFDPNNRSSPLLLDSLRRLNVIINHTSRAASEIEELGPNASDWGTISQSLFARHGVTLSKFRDCCDELMKIRNEETDKAEKWDKTHLKTK